VTIIVTGGAGFIGSHTVERLLAEGHNVIVIDNYYSGNSSNLPNSDGRLFILEKDVSNTSHIKELAASLRDGEVEAIIHLAAIINIVEVNENPQRALDVNVKGTLNMLELARKTGARKMVLASSTAVHGEPVYLPVDEKHPLNPINLYGETKLFSERLMNRYMKDYGLKTLSLRYFNVYGPRMRPGPYAGVVLAFIQALLQGRTPVIYGTGEQTRDFVYVGDVANANIKALKTSYTGPVEIGSGRETRINDLYRIICSIIGRCPEPRHMPPRPGDVSRSVANINLAMNELGWRPMVSLKEGLRHTIDYYRNRKR
jgi:UDP-glucose 4-epimerase